MSFDPQPIRLRGYTSTYVDPKYDVMLESLNKRYEANYAANDALEAQLLQLESAPFEADKAERIKLIKDTQSKLQEFADRGDFENLSLAVARTAKEYSKQAAPISANYKAYGAYKNSLDEMVKSGDIDAGTKNKLLGYSSANYTGFKKDPQTGMADPSSMFVGVGAVKDPKVLNLLDEHLAKIKADGDKSKIKRVDQVQYDASGNPLPGRYEVLTENGWEKVSEEDVLNSFNTIMAEPGVKSWLGQQAVLNTYDMDANKLNTWAQSTYDSYANIKQSLGEKKTELESKAGDILKQDPSTLNTQQQQVVNAYNSINSQLGEVDRRMTQFKGAAGNEQALRSMAVQGWYEDKYKEYQNYATNTFGYSKTDNTSEITWDSKYLKEVEQAAKLGAEIGAEVITEMPALEINPNTGSYSAITNSIKISEENIKKLEKQLSDPNNPLSDNLKESLEVQKRNLESNINFQKEALNRAFKQIGVDNPEDINKSLKNEFVNIGVDKDTKQDVNLSQDELITIFKQNNFDTGKTIQWLAANKNIVIAEGQVISAGRRAVDLTSIDGSKFLQKLNLASKKAYTENKSPESEIYLSVNEEKLAAVQDILNKKAKIAVTMTNMFPGMTDQERKLNTKSIRQRFEKGIDTGLPVWVEGQDPNTASNINQLIKDGIIPIDYVVDVNKIAINTESGSAGNSFGEDIIVLPIKKEDSEGYVNIFVPANSVYTPTMKQALNAPANRFSRIMTKASTLPELSGEENYYNHKIVSTAPGFTGPMTFQINPSNNTVRVLYNGNTSVWYAPNDSQFKDRFLNVRGIGDKF